MSEPTQHTANTTSEPRAYQKQHSVLTNEGDVFDIIGAEKGIVEQGTIVTDKKRERRSMWSVVRDASKEWAGGARSRVEQLPIFTKEPGLTVADPHERVEVITEAATFGKQRPSDDHKSVISRIKTLESDARHISHQPITLREAPKPRPAQWGHFVGETATQPRTIPPERSTPPPAPLPTAPPTPKPLPTAPSAPQQSAPETTASAVFHGASQQEKSVPRVSRRTTSILHAFFAHRKSLAVGLLGVLLIGSGTSWYLARPTQPVATEPPAAPSFFPVTLQTPILLNPSTGTFHESLAAHRNINTSEIEQLYPVVTVGSSTPTTTSELLSVLAPHLNPALARTADETSMVGFVTVDEKREPFIIISVPSFDTTFGSMLAWEAQLTTDLYPFFSVTHTASFSDIQIEGQSMRAQYFTPGTTAAVYGFVGRNFLIITETPNAFVTLSLLIQQSIAP